MRCCRSLPALALVLSFCISMPAAGQAHGTSPSVGKIASALQPFVDSHSLAGAVTLVADKDKVLSLDAVGFAAAIAHRGLRLVRLPTTTLAQADSGVGVKNGVNLFGKKNWLGAFAVPWAVINDIHAKMGSWNQPMPGARREMTVTNRFTPVAFASCGRRRSMTCEALSSR